MVKAMKNKLAEKQKLLEKTSSRLRHTVEIAKICEFEYNNKGKVYGGFFSVYELEQIARKLNQLVSENNALKQKI